MEMHRRQLGCRRVDHVHVQGLGLIDVGTSICCHVENCALLDLPHRLVQLFYRLWEVQTLYAPVVGDKLHAQVFRPQLLPDEVIEQMSV